MRDELWLKHDARSRIDLKMVAFIKRTKASGYGLYWALVEVLHYQRDHELPLEELGALGDSMGLSDLETKNILDCAVVCGLFVVENNRVWQTRLKQDQAERSKTKQIAGRIGGLRSGESRRAAASRPVEADSQKGEQIQAKSKQSLEADEATKLEEREERERKDINTKAKVEKVSLLRFGTELLSMSKEQMEKLEKKFGRPLVNQELPEAEEWLKNSDTPNGRKYRKPNYNHYLFFRGWLGKKKLNGAPFQNQQQSRPQPKYEPVKIPIAPPLTEEQKKANRELLHSKFPKLKPQEKLND